MSEATADEMEKLMEQMFESVNIDFKERTVVNTPIWFIEHMMPMDEFKILPVDVQYLLITQSKEIENFHHQIETIREHLDSTPL